MKFRRPSKSDLQLLAQWNHRLIRDERHRNRMTIPQLKRRMSGWLKKEYLAFLFEIDRVPIGYVLYRKERDHIYLRQFFIDRPYRRKGFGRKAMKLLFTHVWPKNSRVVLDVLVHNNRAIHFWKLVGFKDYCLIMEKGLPGS